MEKNSIPEPPLFLIEIFRADEVFADYENEADLGPYPDPVSVLEILREKKFRIPLAVGIFANLAQISTGVHALWAYGPFIFGSVGIRPENSVFYFLVPVFFGSFLSFLFSETFGRRFIFLSGFFLSIISVFFLIIFLKLNENFQNQKIFSYFSFFFLIFYLIFFSFGPKSISVFLPAEIFPISAKTLGNSLAHFSFWIFSVISMIFVPIFHNFFGVFSLFIFFGISLGIFGFLYKFMPETKGRPIFLIVNQYRTGKLISLDDYGTF